MVGASAKSELFTGISSSHSERAGDRAWNHFVYFFIPAVLCDIIITCFWPFVNHNIYLFSKDLDILRSPFSEDFSCVMNENSV